MLVRALWLNGTVGVGKTTPRLVRIVASVQEIEHRLRARHGRGDGSGLHRHLERAPELNEILNAGDLSMTIVDSSDTPLATVKAVAAAIG